ncbi:7355a69f-163d-4fd8-ab87-b5b39b655e1c [Sclerotinia trifoliorum]|uniref:7355a69f-163d-4fd8-ab87-b5b39b655e1c n=1 Tax=Sclerotinia trifoliorum TaxID=28548 RepID=A0A8H2VUR9_9HELO|nr:7355a69f-163d-4fd8-ab87-b5b39b655e1c [Sclerotinia trifoliorum]
MSHLLIPIGPLKLTTILREKVFVKWVSPDGTASTLGSRLSQNGQCPELLMTASYDTENYIHVDFSLMLAVKMGGKFKRIEIMFVAPPNLNFPDDDTVQLNANSNNYSALDVAALHDAGISDERDHVIHIPLRLTTEGFVIMKKTNSVIRLQTVTSKQLILNMKSLSNASVFDIYIRPSDHAREGLKELRMRLGSTGSATPRSSRAEMYVQHGSMLVEWDRFMFKDSQLFSQHPSTQTQLSPEMSLPHASPVALDDVELSDTDVDFHDFDHNLSSVEMDVGICSDEGALPNEQSPDLDLQINQETLQAKLSNWVNGALKLHPDVFQHRSLIDKLAILGDCVRRSNSRTFDHTISWCSALLFYDPSDSGDDQLWEDRNRWVITRIARMISWINKYHVGAEFSSVMFSHFVKLGRVARTFALSTGSDDTEFRLQRSVCISRILTEFDGLRGSGRIDWEFVAVSRKRNAVEDCGSTPKRGRNTM